MTRELDPNQRAAVLLEALPYIQRFAGAVIVVKYGGNALSDSESESEALASFASDIVLLRSIGMNPVVVHGGGPQIGDLMVRLGKEPVFSGGLRVTDADTLDIARMVLVGRVNPELVSAINVHGPLAVGLSGADTRLINARQRDEALGFVGDITSVNPTVIEQLLRERLIPVVATIGADSSGQAFNINADTAAGAIAAALRADKLIYLTNIDGLRRDVADPATRLSTTTSKELRQLIDDGSVSDGMIPKVASCADAVEGGVRHAHILDGRVPHALLLEILTNAGVGTMVTAGDSA